MAPRTSGMVKIPPAPWSSPPKPGTSHGPAATTPTLPNLKVPAHRHAPPPQRTYPDYIRNHTSPPGWDAAVAIGSVVEHIPAFPLAIAGPLRQVVDVVSGIIRTVNLMRQNRDDCAHLIGRIVRFLQSLVDDLRSSNVPILHGTRTTVRLFALKRLVFHRLRISSLI
jgi:hypothetical protein